MYIPDSRPSGAAAGQSNQVSWRLQTSSETVVSFWCSRPELLTDHDGYSEFELRDGESATMVMTAGKKQVDWNDELIRRECDKCEEYWRTRLTSLNCPAENSDEFKRTAMLLRLLSYAPTGSVVAAPTTSLPERIGGDWNADYRLSWVRDTSLALSLVTELGDLGEAQRYMHWLSGLESHSEMPLQVVYGIRGERRVPQGRYKKLRGYRGSRPVRSGNHAYKQLQLDSFGFFAICVYDFLESGGQWRDEFWRLAQDVADFVAANWSRAGNGIWELPKKAPLHL